MLSDSDSSDSDTGRRYKTESTRSKEEVIAKISARNGDYREKYDRRDARSDYSRRSKSRTPEYRKRRERERSRSKSREESSSRRRSSPRDKRKSNTSSSSSSMRREHEYFEKTSKQRESDEPRQQEKSTKNQESKTKSERQRNESSAEHSGKHHKKSKESKRHRDEGTSKHSNLSKTHTDKKIDELPQIGIEREESRRIDDQKVAPVNEGETMMCGPSLPPHMLMTNKPATSTIVPKLPSPRPEKRYGPSMPTDFELITQQTSNESKDQPRPDSAIMDISDSEDDDFIGPTPLDHISKRSEAHLELEKRALELKLAKLNKKELNGREAIREREEWMTELPELRKVTDLGLKARQFRAKEHDEIKDRSGWTETPHDRAEKSKNKSPTHDDLVEQRNRKAEKIYRDRRDAEQEALAKKHKKKRDQSLLEIHQKSLKKQSGKDSNKDERRPFSRDTDLQVNRFDEAQKKSILKKAQLLDTRFSSGQSKFL